MYYILNFVGQMPSVSLLNLFVPHSLIMSHIVFFPLAATLSLIGDAEHDVCHDTGHEATRQHHTELPPAGHHTR